MEQLGVLDDAGQGGGFDHGDELVAEGGNDDAHGLGEDDAAEGLEVGHADGGSGFVLAAVDGEHSGANDFRDVGAFVEAESEEGGDEWGHEDDGAFGPDAGDADGGEDEGDVEPEEELEDDGGATEEPGVGDGDGAEDGVGGGAGDGGEDAEDDAEGHGADGHDDGVEETGHDGRPGDETSDGGPVDAAEGEGSDEEGQEGQEHGGGDDAAEVQGADMAEGCDVQPCCGLGHGSGAPFMVIALAALAWRFHFSMSLA